MELTTEELSCIKQELLNAARRLEMVGADKWEVVYGLSAGAWDAATGEQTGRKVAYAAMTLEDLIIYLSFVGEAL